MSTYEDGDTTARGWKGKKYYLSDEAIALLVAHCKGTPLTMSAYLDQLIKTELTPHQEVRKVVDEGRRQLSDLTREEASAMTPEKFDRAAALSPSVPQQPAKKDFKVDL